MYRLHCARSSISFGRSVLDSRGRSEIGGLTLHPGAEAASLASMVDRGLGRQLTGDNCGLPIVGLRSPCRDRQTQAMAFQERDR